MHRITFSLSQPEGGLPPTQTALYSGSYVLVAGVAAACPRLYTEPAICGRTSSERSNVQSPPSRSLRCLIGNGILPPPPVCPRLAADLLHLLGVPLTSDLLPVLPPGRLRMALRGRSGRLSRSLRNGWAGAVMGRGAASRGLATCTQVSTGFHCAALRVGGRLRLPPAGFGAGAARVGAAAGAAAAGGGGKKCPPQRHLRRQAAARRRHSSSCRADPQLLSEREL